MPDPTPTLTDEQRGALDYLVDMARGHDYAEVAKISDAEGVLYDALTTVARMVADAEQRGRAEVSAAVEAVWPDPFGEFTAAEATAAKLMKDAIRARIGKPAPAQPDRARFAATWNEAWRLGQAEAGCELQRSGDGTHGPLIRQAKAEALREAADEWRDLRDILAAEENAAYAGGSTLGLTAHDAAVEAECWLRDRADRIGGEGD